MSEQNDVNIEFDDELNENLDEEDESKSTTNMTDSDSMSGTTSGFMKCFMNIEDDYEPFYFESDTLALRNNTDYNCLLKTLVLLEAQRIKACQDLETLIDLKETALKEPFEFVKCLTNKQNDNKNDNLLNKIPQRQKVYVLPEIDWDKYYQCVDLADLEAIKTQNIQRVHSLRQSAKIIQQMESVGSSGGGGATTSSSIGSENSPSTTRSSRRQQSQQQQQQQLKQDADAKSYNKSWSVDEQRRLEELLIEFPPEDNEAARFRKIACKLGSRTPLQVQSHCQKYFIKLAKAGLPIPGRMPNLKTYVTKKGNRGNRRSALMRGACVAAGLGSGRGMPGAGCGGGGSGSGNGAGTSGVGSRDITGRKMVGRGVSLNEISSMWTSFNPPITMNDDNEYNDDDIQDNSNSNYEQYDDTENNTEDDDDENQNESTNSRLQQNYEDDENMNDDDDDGDELPQQNDGSQQNNFNDNDEDSIFNNSEKSNSSSNYTSLAKISFNFNKTRKK